MRSLASSLLYYKKAALLKLGITLFIAGIQPTAAQIGSYLRSNMRYGKEGGSTVIGSSRNLGSKKTPEALSDDVKHVESLGALEKSKSPRSLKSFRANVQKHWRRFWCCYLVATIIFLAIFLPVL
jgi:hypothetical protein